MSWHVEAEMVAFVIVGIILIYSREGNMLPTLKNRVFQLCLFTTFLSIGLNIASVCLIAAGSAVPVILTDVVNTLYFVATPAMALTYFYYTVAYVYEHSARIRRMRKQFSQPWDVFGSGCMVYAGIGVARAWQLKLSVEELVSALECAVAEAKEGSTGRVVVCDDRMVARMKRKHAVTEILKEELLNQGFEVYYQPIYRCKDGGFPVAEALLRLPDTPLGPIYPDEFIPIAEETGLIVQMTYLVLAKVCKFVRRLLDEGAKLEGVSVNLSVLQFMQRDLADHIAEILDYYQVPARFIKLEITESVVASNYEAVLSVMEKLAKKGVQFALDDFGTGYSNLSYVMHLPVDMVKIDRSLIWSSLNNDRCATLVEAVSRTFGQAGIRMIAEGVETGEQAAFAQRCGIELIQGFLYAKPMPQEEALPYLMGVKELVNK